MGQKTLNLSDVSKEATVEESRKNKQEIQNQGFATTAEINSPKDKAEKDSKNQNKKISKKWIFVASFLALILILIAGALFYLTFKAPDLQTIIATIPTNYVEAGEEVSYKLSFIGEVIPNQPKTEENPINGTLYTRSEFEQIKKRAPIAVMINNHVRARPQSAIPQADIVYETMAEGGITRLMGIFWSNLPEKTGPVRSARQYYIEWLSEFDAIYVHDGCARSTDPRVNACGNIYTYNIKNSATSFTWRVYDDGRVAPHNEYVSLVKVSKAGDNRGWNDNINITPWKFKNDALPEERGPGKTVSITFWQRLAYGGIYDVQWVYDPATNSYVRWIGGKKDKDLESGSEIRAKDVIIQYVTMTPTYDEKAHVIIETIGSGDALILRDGEIIKAKWYKKDRTSRTKFKTEDGKEVEFNRGLIWVEAVPQEQGKVTIKE